MGTSSIWRVWADCDAANVRTAKGIEELSDRSDVSKKKSGPKPGSRVHANSLKNLKPYVPGQSGNPGGKPKVDHAQAIARAIFENDSEEIYKAFVKALRAGNAYSFDVLASRAFGKMKDTVDHAPTSNLTDDELNALIAEKISRLKNESST